MMVGFKDLNKTKTKVWLYQTANIRPSPNIVIRKMMLTPFVVQWCQQC